MARADGPELMIVVLAERWDAGARAVHDDLTRRVGAEGVVRVPPAELVRARWRHRVTASGDASSTVRLPSGRTLEPAAVLNRMVVVPAGRTSATQRDRDYSASELNALIASWLLGLGRRVIGPTAAYATAHDGAPAAGMMAAERCGLPVRRRAALTRGGLIGPPRPGERHVPRLAWPGEGSAPVPVDVVPDLPVDSRVLVVGERAHGALATRFGAEARRLARELDTTLLELSFAQGPEGPAVVEVSALPGLESPGEVEAVGAALVAAAGGCRGC